jgi:hypothetical protein
VGEIGVEGAHGHEDPVGILPELADPVVAVADGTQTLLPSPDHVVGEAKRVDAGLVKLEVAPEQQHQHAGELAH